MAKNEVTRQRFSDDDIKGALIEIQHIHQRPMTFHEFGIALQEQVPGMKDNNAFFDSGRKRAVELFQQGKFVQAPKRVIGPNGKLVMAYGLPEYVPNGIAYTEKVDALIVEKIGLLSGMMAASTLFVLQGHIKDQKIAHGEGTLSADDLKINVTLLRDITIKTLIRLAAKHGTLLSYVANATISDEQLEEPDDRVDPNHP